MSGTSRYARCGRCQRADLKNCCRVASHPNPVVYDPIHCQYYILRAVSATFGSLLVPLVFSIARKLGCTNKGALLAGCFVTFDMLNTTESRLVLMDAQLMFYSTLSLWLALKFWQRFDPDPAAYPPSSPPPPPLTDAQITLW